MKLRLLVLLVFIQLLLLIVFLRLVTSAAWSTEKSVVYQGTLRAPSYDDNQSIYFLGFENDVDSNHRPVTDVLILDVATLQVSPVVRVGVGYYSILAHSVGNHNGDIYFVANLGTIFKFNAKTYQVTVLCQATVEVTGNSTLAVINTNVFLIGNVVASYQIGIFYINLTTNETVKVIDIPDSDWGQIVLIRYKQNFYLFGSRTGNIFKVGYNFASPSHTHAELLKSKGTAIPPGLYNFVQTGKFIIFALQLALQTIDLEHDETTWDSSWQNNFPDESIAALSYTEENSSKYLFLMTSSPGITRISKFLLCDQTVTTWNQSHVVVPQYEDFLVECNVLNKPKPVITWDQDYKNIPSTKSTLNGRGWYLFLTRPFHARSYVCHADGVCGKESRSIYVTVAEPKQPISRTFLAREANVGSTEALDCQGISNRNQFVGWLKGDEVLYAPHSLANTGPANNQMQITSDKSLILLNVNESEQGIYTCLFEVPPHDRLHAVDYNLTLKTKENSIVEAEEDTSAPTALLGGTVILVGMLALLSLYIYNKYKKLALMGLTPDDIRRFNLGKINVAETDTNYRTDQFFLDQPYNTAHELPFESFEIRWDTTLGMGQFGVVYKGMVKVGDELVDAAFKAIRPATDHQSCQAEQMKCLMAELKLMSYIGNHKHVVRLLGAYTRDLRKGKIYIALEYCSNGSLEHFLKKATHTFPTLCEWSLQIARGMEYLASRKVIHADLAARNVLVTSDISIRISDFGLSRRLENYSNYVKKGDEPLPWRWMAPESLDGKNFSTASDVWSFGVTLWETFSYGETPFLNEMYSTEFMIRLKAGLRLGRPELASDKVLVEITIKIHSLQRNHFRC